MREAVARPASAGGLLEWVKTRERKILLLTAAAQILVLLGMIALRAAPLVAGETVLVRVEPVDPRDFFRGDYVILSYGFSRVPEGGIEGLSEKERQSWKNLEGRTVYVPLVLDTNGVHHRAEKVTVVKPDGGLFLKGQIAKYGALKFGIEAFFVQEGHGLRYEQAIQSRKLTAELAVTPKGTAALRALHIE